MIRSWRGLPPFTLLLLAQCSEPNPFADPHSDTDEPGSTSTPDMQTTTTPSSDEGNTTTTDVVTDTTAADDTAGEQDCPAATHGCVAPAPTGWLGPVAIVRDANDARSPTCSAPFDSADATIAYAELDAPTAQCSCTCEPVDPTCGNLSLVVDDAPGCASAESFGTVGVEQSCRTLPPAAEGYFQAGISEVDGGACFPDASSETPTARFEMRATMCVADVIEAPESCGAQEVCAPLPASPFDGSVCIWSPGDIACPAETGYAVRELLHQDFSDTRGCGQCTCGEIAGNCSGTVELWSGDDCDGTLLEELSFAGACEGVDGEVGSVRVSDYEAASPCGAPSGAQPAGQATPTDPITLCCRA